MNYLYELFDFKSNSEFLTFESNSIQVYPHLHIQFEFIYIFDGSINMFINGKNKNLHKGDMCVVSSNQIHSFESNGDSHVFTLIFNKQFSPIFTNLFKNKRLINPFLSSIDINLTNYYCNKLLNPENDNELIQKGYIYILLGNISKQLNFENYIELEDSSLHKILIFVEQNFENNISLKDISKEVGLSTFYISKIFNEKIGCSLTHYIKTLRINKSLHLLDLDYSIIDVAYESGFSNSRSFYRAFNEIMNTTPKNYKKR